MEMNRQFGPWLPAVGTAMAIAFGLAACGGDQAEDSVGSLRLIGEQRIPFRQAFEGTVVGGLSGIDYDAASDSWIMISDDKGDLSPARFYTARLDYDARQFKSVDLRGVTFFKQANGSLHPNRTQYAARGGELIDPEAIRFDPSDGSIWWTSEGDRALGLHPFIRQAKKDGSVIGTLPTPGMFKMSSTQQTGARQNLSYEALTFAKDGNSVWQVMEGPTYQDGAPTTASTGAVTRISRYGRDGKVLMQYAYSIDAVPFAPSPGGVAENGVSEMLAVNDHQFLLLERAVVQTSAAGAFKFSLRIVEIDIDGATDISAIPSLQGATYTPVKKRLVLDLAKSNVVDRLDNIEGIAWGPRLANGNRSLVLMSDDNFLDMEVTQFLAIEVLPK